MRYSEEGNRRALLGLTMMAQAFFLGHVAMFRGEILAGMAGTAPGRVVLALVERCVYLLPAEGTETAVMAFILGAASVAVAVWGLALVTCLAAGAARDSDSSPSARAFLARAGVIGLLFLACLVMDHVLVASGLVVALLVLAPLRKSKPGGN